MEKQEIEITRLLIITIVILLLSIIIYPIIKVVGNDSSSNFYRKNISQKSS